MKPGLDRGPPSAEAREIKRGHSCGLYSDVVRVESKLQSGVQLWAEQINPISTYAWKPMLPFGSSAASIVPNLASYFVTLSCKALIILFI